MGVESIPAVLAQWLTAVRMGGQGNCASLFELLDFLKGEGCPYLPQPRPSSGPSLMCPVASYYPNVAGLVIQLHASIILKEGRKKSHVQRNIDF